jgi:hypothetical protein
MRRSGRRWVLHSCRRFTLDRIFATEKTPRGSNLHPSGLQSDTLPTAPHLHLPLSPSHLYLHPSSQRRHECRQAPLSHRERKSTAVQNPASCRQSAARHGTHHPATPFLPPPPPPSPLCQRVIERRIVPALTEIFYFKYGIFLRQDVEFFSISTFYVRERTIGDSMWSWPRKRKIYFRKF